MARSSFVIDIRVLALVSVSVPVVHEEMHRWTGEQEQEGQEAQYVDGVLIDDERRRHEAERQEHRLADRTPFV
jgi:hypothetical protein